MPGRSPTSTDAARRAPAAGVAAVVAETALNHTDPPWRNFWNGVAAAPWITPALARKVSEHSRWSQRAKVAANPACPPDLLAELAVAGCADALTNPSLPFERALALGGRPHQHPACPGPYLADLLEQQLATSARRFDNKALRVLLAHPNLPADSRARASTWLPEQSLLPLLANPSLSEGEGAALLDRFSEDALDLFDSHLGRAATIRWAASPHPDADWLDRTARNYRDDLGVVQAVLRNPRTPARVLSYFARPELHHPYASSALAHPAIPSTASATAIVATASKAVLRAVALNPVSGPHLLARIDTTVLYDFLRLRFVLTHARSAEHAASLLDRRPWQGTLGSVLGGPHVRRARR